MWAVLEGSTKWKFPYWLDRVPLLQVIRPLEYFRPPPSRVRSDQKGVCSLKSVRPVRRDTQDVSGPLSYCKLLVKGNMPAGLLKTGTWKWTSSVPSSTIPVLASPLKLPNC